MDDNRLRMNEERRRQNRRKKAMRKNITIFIETVLIIILTVALIVVSVKYSNLKNSVDIIDSSSQTSSDDVSSNDNTSSNQSDVLGEGNTSSNNSNSSSENNSGSANINASEVDKWYLKLVNPDISVSKEFIRNVELSTINSRFSSNAESSKYFDSRAIKYFEDMCKAALEDNITLISVSSYRTYAYQNTLHNNRIQRCINEGLSEEEAKRVAATIVAKPGTSEHHLGLAVDINEVEERFDKTDAFKWLQKNAADYGFVMRYPKDKQNITKIIYEPWHYRYVGVEHAKAMNSLNMCLEEYIEYLKNAG